MGVRNKLVDMLKGYACFLVVFGHVIMGIQKSIPEVANIFFKDSGFYMDISCSSIYVP